VRARYGGRDAVAAGAWTWFAPDSSVWVLVDVQSTVPDVVQARAELWLTDTSQAMRVGRSDVLPAAAELGAYAFDDLTGDGWPDFFGYVADSAGVSFPVFFRGARGAMADELEIVAGGYRFSTDDATLPQVVAGPSGACALQLWVEASPDSSPPGWRYLTFGLRGALTPPAAAAPTCR